MFNYNVIMMLEAIKYRPCLWDKTLASYKDRGERRAAWEEVFSILDPKFVEMSEEQKRFMCKYYALFSKLSRYPLIDLLLSPGVEISVIV